MVLHSLVQMSDRQASRWSAGDLYPWISAHGPISCPTHSPVAGILWRPWLLQIPLPCDEPHRSEAIKKQSTLTGQATAGTTRGATPITCPDDGRFHVLVVQHMTRRSDAEDDECGVGIMRRPSRLERPLPDAQSDREEFLRGLARPSRECRGGQALTSRYDSVPFAGSATQEMLPVSPVDCHRDAAEELSTSSVGTAWDLIDVPRAVGPANPTRNMHLFKERGVGVTVCEVCSKWFIGEPQPFKFRFCSRCGAAPSYHHGRCCPLRQDRDRESGGSSAARRGRAAMASMAGHSVVSAGGGQTDGITASETSPRLLWSGERFKQCEHLRTVGGANQFASWTKCKDCGVRLSTTRKPDSSRLPVAQKDVC